MKTILYDLYHAQPHGDAKYHGGGEYIKSVFEYLAVNSNGVYRIVTFYNNAKFIDEWILKLIEKYNIEVFDTKDFSEIQSLMNTVKFDIFFTGLANVYQKIRFSANAKNIGTIHGLRNLECVYDGNERFYLRNIEVIKEGIKGVFKDKTEKRNIQQMEFVLNKYDKLVVDSYHTEYALRTWLNLNVKMPIVRIYAPSKKVTNYTEEDDIECSRYGKYILFIGAGRWEKNVISAIEASDELFNKGKMEDTKVVVCGKLPEKIIRRIKNRTRFILLDYVTTSKLEALYKNCDFFVYPTLNEGFGLPPLEAMKYQKTCAISAICSLPEVYGDAVYYFNPMNKKEIENRILQAYDNKINPEYVLKKVSEITSIQNRDLERLRKYIIE